MLAVGDVLVHHKRNSQREPLAVGLARAGKQRQHQEAHREQDHERATCAGHRGEVARGADDAVAREAREERDHCPDTKGRHDERGAQASICSRRFPQDDPRAEHASRRGTAPQY